MKITASKLRENVYAILDEALETGVPVEITRKGQTLRIVPEPKKSKFDRIKKKNHVIGDIRDLIHMDWYHLWSEAEKESK